MQIDKKGESIIKFYKRNRHRVSFVLAMVLVLQILIPTTLTLAEGFTRDIVRPDKPESESNAGTFDEPAERPSRDIPKESVDRPSRDIPKEVIDHDRDRDDDDGKDFSPMDWITEERETLNPSSPHDWVIEEEIMNGNSWTPQDWITEEREGLPNDPINVELRAAYEEEQLELLMLGAKDLGKIFDKLEISLNGDEIKPGEEVLVDDGSVILIKYHFTIPNRLEVNDKDYATIQLPKGITPTRDLLGRQVPVKMGDVIIGYFTIDGDNLITLEFNGELKSLEDREGSLQLGYQISKSDFENNTLKEIKFNNPEEKEFTVKFNDNFTGETITKKGIAEPATNPQFINWTVDINTNRNKLEDVVVTDNLPEGLELAENSLIEIYSLSVGMNGKLTKGKLLRKDKAFPINLGKRDNAYRIEFKTKITNRGLKQFKNIATINAKGIGDVSADSTVLNNRTIDLRKSGMTIDNSKKVAWSVKVNNEKAPHENLKLVDNIGEKQKLIKDSIKISENGVNVSDLSKFPMTLDDRKLEIDFGKTESNFVVDYETEVIFTDEDAFGQTIELKNKAMTISGDTKEEKEANVWVYRQKLIQKWNAGAVVDQNENGYKKYIPWTITINEGREHLENVVVSDELPDGVVLDEKSIFVYDNLKGTTLEKGKDFTVEIVGNKLSVIFTEAVDDTMRIEYRTYITDYNKVQYLNNATISSNGKEKDKANSGLSGAMLKSLIDKRYTSINYDDKTVDWEITIQSRKGKFTKVELTDYMSSNHDLVSGSVKLVLDGQELKRDVDYFQIDDSTRDKFGFVLLDEGLYKSKGDSKLIITYKSTFKILEGDEETVIDKLLKNKVSATVHTEKGEDEKLNAEKFLPLEGWVAQNGSKFGVLDKDAKRVRWTAYLNPLGTDYDEIDLTDSLSEGQEFDPESLRVFSYHFDGESPKLGELIPEFESTGGSKKRNYTLTPREDKLGFTLTMNGLYTPVALLYDSLITGLAKEYYNNEITVDEDYYDASVKDDKFDRFVEKHGNIEGNTVYKGDVIEWAVKVNESRSDIVQAEFSDEISDGQKLLEKTLKIRDRKGKDVDVPKDHIKLSDNPDGSKQLTIDLGDIYDMEIITYSTLVTSKEGTISNKAKVSGKGFLGFEHNVAGIDVKEFASGVGIGHEGRGTLEIEKIDQDGNIITTDYAEFKLYQIIEGEKTDLDTTIQTTNGKLEPMSLKYGDYVLKEVKSPKGYKMDETEIPFTVSKDEAQKKVSLKIENIRVDREIELFKVDSKDNKVRLSGAKFEVKNEDGTLFDEVVTDSNGVASIENPRLGKYTITEIEAPVGYKLDKTAQTIEITNDKTEYELTFENTKDESKLNKEIKIIKVDSKDSSKKLADAKFEIKDDKGNKVGETLITDKNGVAIAKNIKPGKYTITELEAPKGYKLDKKPQTIKVVEDKDLYELTFKNVMDPKTPEEPTKPTKPGDPKDPEDPKDKPEKPVRPKDPKDPKEPEYPEEEPGIPTIHEDPDRDKDGKLPEYPEESVEGNMYPDGDKESPGIHKGQTTLEKEREGKGVLPKTGEVRTYGNIFLGLALIVLGIVLRKRNKNKN